MIDKLTLETPPEKIAEDLFDLLVEGGTLSPVDRCSTAVSWITDYLEEAISSAQGVPSYAVIHDAMRKMVCKFRLTYVASETAILNGITEIITEGLDRTNEG